MRCTIDLSAPSAVYGGVSVFVRYTTSKKATEAAFGRCRIGRWTKTVDMHATGNDPRTVSVRDVSIVTTPLSRLLGRVFPGLSGPIVQTLTTYADGLSVLHTSFLENGFPSFFEISGNSATLEITSGVADDGSDPPGSRFPFGSKNARKNAGLKAAARACGIGDYMVTMNTSWAVFGE